MKKKLFTTAILYHLEGKDTTLLYGPSAILSVDQESAKIEALRNANIDSNIPSDLLEVIVRPF